jgi:hypothetical protein
MFKVLRFLKLFKEEMMDEVQEKDTTNTRPPPKTLRDQNITT